MENNNKNQEFENPVETVNEKENKFNWKKIAKKALFVLASTGIVFGAYKLGQKNGRASSTSVTEE